MGIWGKSVYLFVPKVSRRRSSLYRAIICCTYEAWNQGWDVNDEQRDPPCLLSQSLSLSVSQLSKVPMESETLHLSGYAESSFRVQRDISLDRHTQLLTVDDWCVKSTFFCVCVLPWELSLNFLVSQPRRWIPAPWKWRGSACYNAAEDVGDFQLLTHCVCD